MENVNVIEEIDYWIEQAEKELNCFNPNGGKEQVRNQMIGLYNQGILRWYFLEDKKGIMVYCITPDFRGDTSVNELFMYIKPEYRGNIKLFKELVTHLEAVAIIQNCKSVRIASNIGYNDTLVLKCLQRFGYSTDVVVKNMR
ncbi:MAG: hypothetical protein LUG16_03020 [Candidatus Gastranaerophilales bacterium]|nr:hypothetical protein [Candidatus Gastranaerophilales bacterium]